MEKEEIEVEEDDDRPVNGTNWTVMGK